MILYKHYLKKVVGPYFGVAHPIGKEINSFLENGIQCVANGLPSNNVLERHVYTCYSCYSCCSRLFIFHNSVCE